jgi:probable rRNA maturation factor
LTQENSSKNLDASSDVDVPPRSWSQLTFIAGQIAHALFPREVVALRIMDDAAIRCLNREFRSVDQPTDILSFPADASDFPQRGDLALNWDAVLRQARANGNNEVVEAAALVAHGMLHLAGHDHPDEQSQAEMDRLTRELCSAAGIKVENFGH